MTEQVYFQRRYPYNRSGNTPSGKKRLITLALSEHRAAGGTAPDNAKFRVKWDSDDRTFVVTAYGAKR